MSRDEPSCGQSEGWDGGGVGRATTAVAAMKRERCLCGSFLSPDKIHRPLNDL